MDTSINENFGIGIFSRVKRKGGRRGKGKGKEEEEEEEERESENWIGEKMDGLQRSFGFIRIRLT